jgi:hypothetical protein
MTWLLSAFLVAHGVIHLAVWLAPSPPPGDQVPFTPDHSALLTRTRVPRATAHRLAVRLAVTATVAYVGAGMAVAVGSGWAVGLAAAAAVLGLSLKALYFNLWLSLGVLLDALILSAAVAGWPITLT